MKKIDPHHVFSMRHVIINFFGAALIAHFFCTISHAEEKAFIFPHPWQASARIDGRQIENYKKQIAPLLHMQDQEISTLIPARRPVKGDLSQLGAAYTGKIAWSPDRPRFLTINRKRFIPEIKFPPTGVDRVESPDGRIWEYEFVVGKNGDKIYITSVRDSAARDWLKEAAFILARLYTATGNNSYAHKAAVILCAFADVVPSYVIYGQSSSRGAYGFHHREPYPERSGRFGTWYPTELRLMEPLVLAYDLILPSGVIQRLSIERGRDLNSDIDHFFLSSCALIQKYDGWYAKTPSTRTNNLQPYKCSGMIAIGRTLERPDLIHYAFSFIEEMINRRFGLDGVFPESPSYHYQVVQNLDRVLDYLKEYTDPPDFRDPATNRRFDDFDPDTAFPTYKKAKRFLRESAFPDGRTMSIHDTWVKPNRSFKRDSTRSRIWPSFGHAVLGRGLGKHQMEAHLDYGLDFSHRHRDTLNLTLWACGEELLSDIGYTYTYRGWTIGSLSHNLVVVDGMVQRAGILTLENSHKAIGGRIVTWAPVSHGFGVMEAEDINSYPQCSIYRRTIMTVEDSPANAFIVDIFEVSGGERHDYMAHGSADKHQTLSFNTPMRYFADSLAADGRRQPMKLTKELYGTPNPYGDLDRYGDVSQYWAGIGKIKKTSGNGPWEGCFSGLTDSDASLRMHLLAPLDCEIYTGEAPSVRRAKEDPSRADDFMMPILTARRSGRNLSSRYVVVWEPFRQKPWLKAVKLVNHTRKGLILSVNSDHAEYTVFWSPPPGVSLDHNGVYFNGRFGVGVSPHRSNGMRISGVDAVLTGTRCTAVGKAEKTMLTVVAAEADNKGEYLSVSEKISSDGFTEQWGILHFFEKHTRAILLAPIENGNIIRCPRGHGLHYDKEKSLWHETNSPGRTFEGPITLRLIRRHHGKMSAPSFTD